MDCGAFAVEPQTVSVRRADQLRRQWVAEADGEAVGNELTGGDSFGGNSFDRVLRL